MKMLSWKKDQISLNQAPIIKVPLQFLFEPVEILSKELTKLNSPYSYRIHYLGPRWDNSALLHKKYSQQHGYRYNDKQINNNSTFFSESMSQNQFYRNQVYYRAFEGMNPTIQKKQSLCFDSKFQSGNLDCVVKVSEAEYDLFLRIDSNTKGHLFWFYFSISNAKKGSKIRFNLCNLTKTKTLYQKGFKPYTCVQSQNGQYLNWTQEKIENLKLEQKKLRYGFIYERIKVRTLYELSFQYKFTSNKSVRFAYCIPYTYTNLLKQINCLGQSAEVGWLGKSLTGLDIPLLKIGKYEEDTDKPVLFMIGRLHPGQTNGSITLSGVMKHLCLSKQAQFLRKKVITIIVPMLNPDGVVLGNSRTGAAGKDLNREFKTKNKNLFPEVDLLKKLIWNIQQTHDIEVFLDFHGHSRKKNMFLFGPNYNLTQPQYYKSRVIPKFLSNLTPIFRYFGCNYTIPTSKLSTARAVMINELGIPFVYTVQTSVGLYYDYESHKDLPFTQTKWQQVGTNICRALKQYFESVQQYEEFLKLRNAEQQQIRKTLKADKGQKSDKFEKIKPFQNKVKKLSAKEVKLFKLYEEIKVQESKTNKKKEQLSDADSDSQNDEENLQKLKMAQFQGMVTQCIQVQKKRKQKTDEILGRKKQKSPPSLSKKVQRKKKRLSHREELNLMNEVLTNEKEGKSIRNDRNEQIFVFREERKTNRKTKSFDPGFMKKQQDEIILKKCQKLDTSEKNKNSEIQIFFSKNQFFDVQHRQQRMKTNRPNLKMFNFSKMVNHSADSRTIMTSGRYRKQFGRSDKKNSLYPNLQVNPSQITNAAQMKTVDKRYFNISLQDNLQKIEEDQVSQVVKKQQRQKGKQKGVFPAPFYRIKYQNYQKKKLKSLEHHLRGQHESIEYVQPQPPVKKKKHDLFLKIKKFQS